MWIDELLRDAPRGAWCVVIASWLRTGALAASAIAIGGVLDRTLAGEPIFSTVTAAIACALLGAFAGMCAESLPGRIQGEEEARWRQRVVAAGLRVNALEPSHGDRPDRATENSIVDAATSGVEKTGGYRATFLAATFASFTAPIIVLIAWAVGIHPLSALALAGFVALVPAVIIVAGSLLRRSNAHYRSREAQAASRYLEMLEGLGTINVLGAFPRVRREYAESARNAMAELGRLLARNQVMIIVNDAAFGLVMSGAAVALLLWQLAGDAVSAGDAFAGLLLVMLLVEPIDRVGRTFYVGLGGRARRKQLESLLAESGEGPDPAGAPNALRAAGDLELSGVTVSHGDRTVLDGVDLRIPAGAHVSVVGPTGAGKSTLLRVVAGLQPVTAGDITLDGEPCTAAHLRQRMNLVSQNASLLSTTVADNLRLVDPTATDAQLLAALEQAHLRGEILTRPHGLAGAVGEGGAMLSGGQRRRLMLARALLRERPVLLLDEATADLDRRTETLVRESLHSAAGGRTVVQVAHRLEMTTDSDLVIVIEGGRITAADSPAELRERPGYYRAALKTNVEQV